MTPDDLVTRFVAAADRAGLVCDFDGTLTPIVDDPEDSVLPAATADTLAALARRLPLVAVVSGRPAAFLGQRVAVPGVRLYGLYGLEEHVDGVTRARPEAASWQLVVRRVRDALVAAVGADAGLRVEDKGLSVAIHWRGASDPAAAGARARALASELAAESGLAREPGKLVEELRPPVEWDKGQAVEAAVRDTGCEFVAYLGDDLGDVPALAAARRLGGVAVAVAQSGETPHEVLRAADLVLDGPAAAAALLARLERALGASSRC